MEETHLQVPLQLAELLHVAFGTLTGVLREQQHSWADLMEMVLKAYQDGRDDCLYVAHGERVVLDINLVTMQVADRLAAWVAELAAEEEDFEKWSEELDDK